MNQEKAKQYQSIINELADKGVVQQRFYGGWTDLVSIDFDIPASNYRPKPEPKLRHWTQAELPQCFVARNLETGILYQVKCEDSLLHFYHGDTCDISDFSKATLYSLMGKYVRLDGDCNETPCGVME